MNYLKSVTFQYFRFHLIIWITIGYTNTVKYHEDYCFDEVFNPSCGTDKVLIVEKAVYGRMKLGKCISEDLGGYLGCSIDVTNVMEFECSGKTSCSLEINDLHKMEKKPCKDLTGYLEITYSCVTVFSYKYGHCQSCKSLKIENANGYISSQKVSQTMCGSSDCPFVISAEKGQTLELTLLDFTYNEDSSVLGGCVKYAMAKESFSEKHSIICGIEKKQSIVYKSKSNSIQLEIYNPANSRFLINHQVIGCPEMTNQHAELLKDGDKLSVKCKNNDLEFTLKCNNSQWIGTDLSNCVDKIDDSKLIPVELMNIQWEFLLILVICVTFLLFSCLFVCCLWCMKRNGISICGMNQTNHITSPYFDEVYDEPIRDPRYMTKQHDVVYIDRAGNYQTAPKR